MVSLRSGSHYPESPTRHRNGKDTVAILKTRFSPAHRSKGDRGIRLAMFSWNWRDFMTNVHGCTFPLDFTLENQGIAETQWRNFFVGVFTSKSESLFSANQNRVFTMSSWSYQVKIRGLKSSIEVQLPTVSGNLKKILYSCLCTSFVICYCVLTEKIDENDSIVTIDHFSRLHGLRIGSLLVSFRDSNVWPGRLLQATVLRYHSTKISSSFAEATTSVDLNISHANEPRHKNWMVIVNWKFPVGQASAAPASVCRTLSPPESSSRWNTKYEIRNLYCFVYRQKVHGNYNATKS